MLIDLVSKTWLKIAPLYPHQSMIKRQLLSWLNGQAGLICGRKKQITSTLSSKIAMPLRTWVLERRQAVLVLQTNAPRYPLTQYANETTSQSPSLPCTRQTWTRLQKLTRLSAWQVHLERRLLIWTETGKLMIHRIWTVLIENQPRRLCSVKAI